MFDVRFLLRTIKSVNNRIQQCIVIVYIHKILYFVCDWQQIKYNFFFQHFSVFRMVFTLCTNDCFRNASNSTSFYSWTCSRTVNNSTVFKEDWILDEMLVIVICIQFHYSHLAALQLPPNSAKICAFSNNNKPYFTDYCFEKKNVFYHCKYIQNHSKLT